jgi:hypothetical protein
VSNNALLLALDSTDRPVEHDGLPSGVLLGANYSVPILWLSLFDAGGLVTWPGFDGVAFTGLVQPRNDCIRRSRERVEKWGRQWPEVFGSMSEPWLSYLSAVERAYLAVWTEEISLMADNDATWSGELRSYLSCLDDPGSANFREALAQSSLHVQGSRLEADGEMGVVTAGYAWEGHAPWEEPLPGS